MRYDGHIRLAHELGKHLHEIMGWNGPMTHRQFIVWQIWLNDRMNTPSLDNYYQMQIACEVRRQYTKNPNKIKVDDFKLKFSTGKADNVKDEPSSDDLSLKEESREIRERLIGFMTAPITVRKHGEVVDTIIPPLVRRKQILEEQKKRREAKVLAKETVTLSSDKIDGRTNRKDGRRRK